MVTLLIVCLYITRLRMINYLTLIVIWAAIMNVTLEIQITQDEMKLIQGRFCGTTLSDMLSVLCNGVYNSKEKRNMYNRNALARHEDYQDIEPIDYANEQEIFPFRSKERARSILSTEFRKRNDGVASECCHKSCTLYEMYGYCGAS